MIFANKRIIFLHLPKTAGNSIQDALEHASDDRRVAQRHQDGVQRFGFTGPLSLGKHAKLSAYAKALGDALPSYRVAIGCREPFERALSMYFSPHRWLIQDKSGPWTQQSPFWNVDRFHEGVSKMSLASDFLRVGSDVRAPEWQIRFEHLQADFGRFVTEADLPLRPLQHLNASAATAEGLAEARAAPQAREIVLARFEADYDLFGYPKEAERCSEPG